MDSASWSLWSLITPIWGFAILLSAVDFTQMLSLKMWGSGAENTYILFLKASGCSFQRILDCVCVCMCLSLQLEPGGDQETFGSKGAFGFQHPVR